MDAADLEACVGFDGSARLGEVCEREVVCGEGEEEASIRAALGPACCHVCRALLPAERLSLACDLFDDAELDASCRTAE